MRTHLILSEELVKKVDTLVGKRRRRSHFVQEAIREKLRRDFLLSSLEETVGVLVTEEHPEWATSEKIAALVREQRQQDEKRREQLRGG